MKITINKTAIIIASAALILGLLLGWLFFGSSLTHESSSNVLKEDKSQTVWTCSMHPQIRQKESGQCPICGMDLIPLSDDNAEIGTNEVRMSPSALELANIQTMMVGAGGSGKAIRLNGKVEIDERRIFTQSTHISGRVEKLNVNYTGDFVNQGDVIAFIYSPELISAQKELLEAKHTKQLNSRLFEAAQIKLKNLKIPQSQIDRIIETERIIEQFPVISEISGIAYKKMINVGDYINRGEALYQIADLSKVWIMFDIYESDVSYVKKGQMIEYTIQGIPNKTFKNRIDFIDPVFDGGTRVTKARVEQGNPSNNAMPGMFVSGTLDIPKDKGNNTITVPKSAVLWTGKRSLVYVRSDNNFQTGFEKREVVLGQSLDGEYEIISGLEIGEEIVVNGTFAVDAAAQLAGKPSMMNVENKTEVTNGSHPGIHISHNDHGVPGNFKTDINEILSIYLQMSTALSSDDASKAKEHAEHMVKSIQFTAKSEKYPELPSIVKTKLNSLLQYLKAIQGAENDTEVRTSFVKLSELIIEIARNSPSIDTTLFVLECPMANNNKGAKWLSKSQKVKNPYYGSSMLTCGSVIDSIR